MKSEPEEIIESMFHINHDIKFDNLKDESLDIDLSACVPLERSSSAALLDLYLTNDESIDYGLTDLRSHSSLVTEFLIPAIPPPQQQSQPPSPPQPPALPPLSPPPTRQFFITSVPSSMISPVKDVESRKNKRKLSQPKRADNHVSIEDEINTDNGNIVFNLHRFIF